MGENKTLSVAPYLLVKSAVCRQPRRCPLRKNTKGRKQVEFFNERKGEKREEPKTTTPFPVGPEVSSFLQATTTRARLASLHTS